ncbi:hypothetical protein HZH68_012774 [Vespula germanica]|uniref:Uncharacterized protein n=1 Tax=Vespula germanica TaxID=30212 RepID=A0A834JFX1_VESGE|nr:hypothetical protein HZH68_012774 [Vespula germanica]
MRPLGFSVFLIEVEHSRRGLSSIRHGTTWLGSSWLELAWPGLISPGLVWSGLAWPGSLFKAIVKIDYETVSRELRLATSHADYGDAGTIEEEEREQEEQEKEEEEEEVLRRIRVRNREESPEDVERRAAPESW